MLNISNQEKFDAVVNEALTKSASFPRWQNAIKKAVVQIEENGTFMEYDETENYLLIWSQGSNEIYSANGICQCKAFEQGFPCFHRAAARLVRNYLELPENKNPAFPVKADESNAPYIKPNLNKTRETCGAIRF